MHARYLGRACQRSSTRTFSTSIPSLRNIAPRNPPPPPPSRNLDATASTHETIAFTGRLLKWIFYVGVGTVTVGLVGFEGLHQYIENGPLAYPSRGDDEYGWEDEIQGWTGGPKGGTDPRLGWRARHAIRAAWMGQTWGGGNASGIIGRQGMFEPDYVAVRGMIGADPEVTFADHGYEYAVEYINIAIDAAIVKGLVFPPELSVVRPPGPPINNATSSTATQGDPSVIDLLLLKAGFLERIGSSDSIYHAKEIYERVVSAVLSNSTPKQEAKIMRLSGKVGELCAKLGDGDEALAWWGWGLGRVGLNIPSGQLVSTKAAAKPSSWSWFDKKLESVPNLSAELPTLSPPVLRAAISLIVSTESYLATHAQVAAAAQLETTGLRLLPPPGTIPQPTASNAGLTLHQTWLQQRSSLLTLHLASTTYALQKPALNLATTAVTRSDAVVDALTPIPAVYTKALFGPARLIHRDALLTSAEASYTRGLLLERQPEPPLDIVAECFERAMSLKAKQIGGAGEEGSMGADWEKYWKSFARVKEKLGQSIEQQQSEPQPQPQS